MSNLCFHESLVFAGCICEYINIAKSRSVLYLLVRQRIESYGPSQLGCGQQERRS
jgi:hypothetical protein